MTCIHVYSNQMLTTGEIRHSNVNHGRYSLGGKWELLIGGIFFLAKCISAPGVKYLEECPVEPKLPIYLMVGGSFGLLKTMSLVWKQIRSRRYERLDVVYDPSDTADDMVVSKSSQFSETVLTLFLLCWFGCGNYWVFHVWPPHFTQPLRDPSNWCDKTVYLVAFCQIVGTYCFMGLAMLVTTVLALCHCLFLDNS